jgi:hypothetical protein
MTMTIMRIRMATHIRMRIIIPTITAMAIVTTTATITATTTQALRSEVDNIATHDALDPSP